MSHQPFVYSYTFVIRNPLEHKLILWIQIPCENLERAAAFYQNTFGVEFFFETLNGIPHAVFKENQRGEKPLNGALIQSELKPEAGRGPILFFDATGKFDFILSQIVAHGGQVLKGKTLISKSIDSHTQAIPRTYIDNREGYFAHVIDSEGNKLGLYGSH